MAENGQLPTAYEPQPVAVDTMGGDHGLGVQVEGAVAAFKEFNAHPLLVGPQEEILAKLSALGASNLGIEVFHASQVIDGGESPTRAVRRKPDSSLCVAYGLVQSGKACSVISAGNSGAMMAAGALISGLLPGIERPAIATLIPRAGDGNPNVILDSGANVECHAQHLVQFAIMGAIYHTCLFNSERPKVALLSNGSEASKGTDVIRAAAAELSRKESINYIGYVEGRDIATPMSDVIVCDGFVGNVVLKAMEGSVRLVAEQLMLEAKKGFFSKLGLGLSKGVFKSVFLEKFDYTAYGGAPLLGLRKLSLVLHGSSDARAVKNAIRIADTFARKRMTERIGSELINLEESTGDLDDNILTGVLNKRNDLRRGGEPEGTD